MEHRKKNIEDENLDPSWRVRYDKYGGRVGDRVVCTQKVEEKAGHLSSFLTPQLIPKLPRSTPHGVHYHQQ